MASSMEIDDWLGSDQVERILAIGPDQSKDRPNELRLVAFQLSVQFRWRCGAF